MNIETILKQIEEAQARTAEILRAKEEARAAWLVSGVPDRRKGS